LKRCLHSYLGLVAIELHVELEGLEDAAPQFGVGLCVPSLVSGSGSGDLVAGEAHEPQVEDVAL
jgi:hypothetical protein